MAGRYALIIGNSRYKDKTLGKISAPAVDVHALESILKDPELGEFDQIETLLNKNSVVAQRKIVEFFSGKKIDDLLLFYYSGHGVLDERGRLYFAFPNTEVDLLRGTAIPSTLISEEMDNCRSRRQVLILDSCHSGAFMRGTKGEISRPVDTAEAFKGSGFGRIIMTASDATQYAFEGDKILGRSENSLFTHYLIEGIQSGAADYDQDGYITVTEMFDYICDHVTETFAAQTPLKWAFKERGNIYIAKSHFKAKKAAAASLPVELLTAIESPLANVRRAAIFELQSLLAGSNRELADLSREQLLKLGMDDSRKVSQEAQKALGGELGKPVVINPASLLKPASERDVAAQKPSIQKLGKTPQETPAFHKVEDCVGTKLHLCRLRWLKFFRAEKSVDIETKAPESRRTIQIVITITLSILCMVAGVYTFSLGYRASSLLNPFPPIQTKTAVIQHTGITPTNFYPIIPTSPLPGATITPALNATITSTTPFTGTVLPATPIMGSFITRPKDGMRMVFVPAGEFSMGTDEPDFSNAQPQHKVMMSDYWIDETDVTNAMFQKFISETGWQTEAEKKTFGEVYRQDKKSITMGNATWLHPRDPKTDFGGLDHPVVQVSWNDANEYCQWAGVSLPTEAQWEKAARGTDARNYPWGGGVFGPDMLNYGDDTLNNWIIDWYLQGHNVAPWGSPGDDGYLFTSPVGNYPKGASPYGAMDMAGNVMQWVYDFYNDGFEGQTGEIDPQGPSGSVLHVLKGSFWTNTEQGSFTFIRYGKPANYTTDYIGFRCAGSAQGNNQTSSASVPVLFADMNYMCLEGPGTTYAFAVDTYEGSSHSIIGRSQMNPGWYQLAINQPNTHHTCCWIGGGVIEGDLNLVPFSESLCP